MVPTFLSQPVNFRLSATRACIVYYPVIKEFCGFEGNDSEFQLVSLPSAWCSRHHPQGQVLSDALNSCFDFFRFVPERTQIPIRVPILGIAL